MPSQRGGLKVNRRPREEVKREPSIDSTSDARRYLRVVQKQGTPEQISEAESRVAELHPDILIERRG